MPLGSRFGAADRETPVGGVRVGRPDLLPVDDPLVAVRTRLGLHVGQIRTGTGFGVALTPEFVHGHDLGEEPLLLFRRPEGDQGGAEKLLAQVVHPSRGVRPRILFMEDDLLDQAEAAASVFDRPTDTGPAVLGQVAVPVQASGVGLVVLARPAETHQVAPLATQLLGQPVPDLRPEVLVRG